MVVNEILHDIKRIANILGDWENSDRDYRKKVVDAFDKLYKNLDFYYRNGEFEGIYSPRPLQHNATHRLIHTLRDMVYRVTGRKKEG